MGSIGEGGSSSSHHPSTLITGSLSKEEPSMREEWLQKIGDIRIPRAAMNKLVMNYLVTEGFKDAAEKFQEEAGISWPRFKYAGQQNYNKRQHSVRQYSASYHFSQPT